MSLSNLEPLSISQSGALPSLEDPTSPCITQTDHSLQLELFYATFAMWMYCREITHILHLTTGGSNNWTPL